MSPDVATTIDHARLTLQSHDISYDVQAGDRLAIDYGSAQLSILVRDAGGSAVIHFLSCVVDDIPVDADNELRLLRSLNERNRTLPYGKFYYDSGAAAIYVEYEI